MPRIFIATSVGLTGFIAYIAAVVTLADHVIGRGVGLETLYFVLAGTLWVAPAWLLLVWAARAPASSRKG